MYIYIYISAFFIVYSIDKMFSLTRTQSCSGIEGDTSRQHAAFFAQGERCLACGRWSLPVDSHASAPCSQTVCLYTSMHIHTIHPRAHACNHTRTCSFFSIYAQESCHLSLYGLCRAASERPLLSAGVMP